MTLYSPAIVSIWRERVQSLINSEMVISLELPTLRRWQTSSGSWGLSWFASAAPTSSFTMPRAAARLSERIKGAPAPSRGSRKQDDQDVLPWRELPPTGSDIVS